MIGWSWQLLLSLFINGLARLTEKRRDCVWTSLRHVYPATGLQRYSFPFLQKNELDTSKNLHFRQQAFIKGCMPADSPMGADKIAAQGRGRPDAGGRANAPPASLKHLELDG
jgi:hypothetical protein